MTNDPSNKAPREFWIIPAEFSDQEDLIFHNRDCGEEAIHVVEHSAYLALQVENARLREALTALLTDTQPILTMIAVIRIALLSMPAPHSRSQGNE